jgi:hypothetical protein
MFPGNIFSDLAYIFIIYFAFRLLKLKSISLFLFSVFYFFLAAIIALIDNYRLSLKLESSITFYMAALFILTFLSYIYEEKIENRISSKKIRKIYARALLFLLVIFLFSATFFNRLDIKVHFFNRMLTDKFFNEIEAIDVDGVKISNDMDFEVEYPVDYSIIKDDFTIEGWAVDESDIQGSKIDYIAVYANNTPQDGGIFLGKCEFGIRNPDIGIKKGEEYVNSGFTTQIDSDKIEDGITKLYVYFHSNNFEWMYEEVDIIVNNDNTFTFNKIFEPERKTTRFENARFDIDGEEIIIKEGADILKISKSPIGLKSNTDYLISFKIKKYDDMDNIISFDFFGEGYDNPEQEFSLNNDDIKSEWIKINRFINSSDIPGNETYFRIFTRSSGSIKIEDLEIHEVIKNNNA